MIWKIIGNIRAFGKKCIQDNINAFAAQTAFFIILSLIPALMLFCGLIRYTNITEEIVTAGVQQVMPTYVAPFMVTILHEVYTKSAGLLSAAGIAAIWSAAKGVQYMANGLNVVFEIEENRNWLIRRIYAVFDTVLFLGVVVVMLVLLVFGNSLQDFILHHIDFFANNSLSGLIQNRCIFLLALLIGLMLIVYVALPNHKTTIKSQLPGAVICAVSLYFFSFALSVYVDYFNGFSMYGSLTTIMLLMLWLYFCMYIIMACGELNHFFAPQIQNLWSRKYKKKK